MLIVPIVIYTQDTGDISTFAVNETYMHFALKFLSTIQQKIQQKISKYIQHRIKANKISMTFLMFIMQLIYCFNK